MTAQDVRPCVEMTGISIEFPGVKALQNVDFRLLPGEVHALMGENGAGKSTLIKALTGIYTVDSGTIRVDGTEVRITSPEQARAAGISTVYQEVNLCENLSVAENIMLGSEPSAGPAINWRATRRLAADHLAAMGLDIDPRSRLGSHSLAMQQLVAICRATSIDAKVLVLDEPTSSLDADEVQQLFRVVRKLRDEGVAILFVSHFLDQVYEISDRMTVLRNGELIGEYLTDETPQSELVLAMIGRSLAVLGDLRVNTHPDALRRPRLQAIGLGRKGAIEPVDLEMYEGHVVGMAGLLGSGRSELARLLCGADVASSGKLVVDGESVRFTNPRRGLDAHIAYSSEDRKSEGIVGDLTVRENIVLGVQAARGWLRRIPEKTADDMVQRYITALNIRPANPDMLIRNLSGGNQQKVLLARWLATQPRLMLLDEPTRGIDVGAKAEILKLVADLAEEGMSVMFISAELEEVLRISNKVVVMRDRRKIAELDNDGTLLVDDIVSQIAGRLDDA